MPDSQEDCHLSNWTILAAQQIQHVCYIIFLPIYYVLGLIGNMILLIAFYKRSKIESAYIYQVLLIVNKTIEVFCFGTYLFGVIWFSGMAAEGSHWFQSLYWLETIVIRGGAVLHMTFIMSSLFFSLVMAIDRLVALWKPFAYKNINHKGYQILSTFVCVLIPLFTSIPMAWIFEIVPVGELYLSQINFVNIPYLIKATSDIFSNIQTVIRLLGIIGLIVLNVMISICYRQRMNKVNAMTNNKEKENERKSANKTLLLLNIFQSILMCVNQIPHVSLHIAMSVSPSFDRCYGTIARSLCDACIFFTDSLDLFVVMTINKKMRAIVKKVMPCANCQN